MKVNIAIHSYYITSWLLFAFSTSVLLVFSVESTVVVSVWLLFRVEELCTFIPSSATGEPLDFTGEIILLLEDCESWLSNPENPLEIACTCICFLFLFLSAKEPFETLPLSPVVPLIRDSLDPPLLRRFWLATWCSCKALSCIWPVNIQWSIYTL